MTKPKPFLNLNAPLTKARAKAANDEIKGLNQLIAEAETKAKAVADEHNTALTKLNGHLSASEAKVNQLKSLLERSIKCCDEWIGVYNEAKNADRGYPASVVFMLLILAIIGVGAALYFANA